MAESNLAIALLEKKKHFGNKPKIISHFEGTINIFVNCRVADSNLQTAI